MIVIKILDSLFVNIQYKIYLINKKKKERERKKKDTNILKDL